MGPKGGELIDHDPDSSDVKRERVRRTRVVYHIFGQEAPNDIWWFFSPGRMPVVVMVGWSGKKHTHHVNPEDSAWSLYKRVEVTLNIRYIDFYFKSDNEFVQLVFSGCDWRSF